MRRRIALFLGLGVVSLLAGAGIVLAAAVEVSVGNYYFEDATAGDGRVVAKVGDQLRLTVVDQGADGRPHTADVDELGIHSGGLPPGSTWVSPVLAKPGTFVLYCKVHLRSRNHATTLVVTGTALTPTPPPPSPTAAPTSTGPSGSPGAGGSAGPGSTASPGPGGSPGSSGGPGPGSGAPSPSGYGASGAPQPTSSADPLASPSGAGDSGDDPLTPGLSGGVPNDWPRSVRFGLLLLIPVWLAAGLALVRSSSRARSLGPGPAHASAGRPGGPPSRPGSG